MCEGLIQGYDIAASAGWYSAIAGLLAGFALLAVLLPLDHDTVERTESAERSGANGITVFTSAFFALLILAFSYAILSGVPSGAVAVHHQQIHGVAFGIAALLLILGLREVLRLYGHNRRMMVPAQNLISAVAGIFGPILVISFQFNNSLKVYSWRATNNAESTICSAGVPNEIWINIAISVAAIIAIALIPLIGRRVRINTHSAALIGKVALVFTFIISVWTETIVPFLPHEYVGGATLEHTILAITAVASFTFGAASWFSR